MKFIERLNIFNGAPALCITAYIYSCKYFFQTLKQVV